jgi:hypothetical protein
VFCGWSADEPQVFGAVHRQSLMDMAPGIDEGVLRTFS